MSRCGGVDMCMCMVRESMHMHMSDLYETLIF